MSRNQENRKFGPSEEQRRLEQERGKGGSTTTRGSQPRYPEYHRGGGHIRQSYFDNKDKEFRDSPQEEKRRKLRNQAEAQYHPELALSKSYLQNEAAKRDAREHKVALRDFADKGNNQYGVDIRNRQSEYDVEYGIREVKKSDKGKDRYAAFDPDPGYKKDRRRG